MRIDLNADLGESFGAWRMGDDQAMLDVVTSANIACGFHAGDPLTMLRVVTLAAQRGVAIGAHVSYKDLAGFGRRYIDISADELHADVLYQLAALAGVCRTVGTTLAYVKPHGALYNALVHDTAQAGAVARAVSDFDPSLVLLGLPGAGLDAARAVGLATAVEAFADRAYASDGTLVPRSAPGAVLSDPTHIADRVLRLVSEGLIGTAAGDLAVDAASVCVHGDTPGAVEIARAVRGRLEAAGVELAPFTRAG